MSNSKKKIVMILLAAIMMMGSFTNTYADSNSYKLCTEDKKEVEFILSELRVEEKVQKKLIKKLEDGVIWDCMDKEQVAQIPESYFSVSIEEPIKRYVFPDGSVIETKLEFDEATKVVKEPSEMSLYGSISGGSSSSGSGYVSYRNVKVSTKKGLLGMGFYADYTNVNRGYDKIDGKRDWWIKGVGASVSDISFTQKTKEDLNGPATATLKCQVSWLGGVGATGTEWLKLHVGNDRSWTSEN